MSVYLIKKFHHVSHERQFRLRQQKLVPILEDHPNESIKDSDVQIPKKGDWLVEYNDKNHPFLLMKVDDYEYLPHKHLFVKHYSTITHSFNVDTSQSSPLFRVEVESKEHLSELSPEAVFSLLNYFEHQLKLIEKSNTKKVTAKSKKTGRTRTPKAKLLYATRWPRPQPLKNRRPDSPISTKKVIKRIPVKPNSNKEMDKQTWAIFNERFPGQQPKKGQIIEIRQEIINNTNKKL